ncbi:MAG: N-acetyl-gamma-glutamyl-phosphate reductase [Deltaproteobacteria bacterium]|nr:N-acetyl-gamma-glutamyl-phosphate reductase [Deltaproteobacteria bacterium]
MTLRLDSRLPPRYAGRVSKRFKAALIGGSGYGGGEIIRRLLIHPDVDLVRVASIDFVGEPVAAAHPNLEGQTHLTFENLSAKEAAEGVDVVLLGLPHKVAAHKVAEIIDAGPRIVDLSGDFRLRDISAYEKYYGTKHPCPELVTRFVYGLPELYREEVRTASYVASPGCFATTIQLGLYPLAARGWLEGGVETVAITGSSGSGVAPSAGTHHPVRAVNLKSYKTLDHQHVPEIVESLTRVGARHLDLRFVPVSAPLSRGILATSFAHVDASLSKEAIKSAFAETYASERFVRAPRKRQPEVAAVSGSNHVEVGVVVGEARDGLRTVTCISALDNLIKGGAGQAIQSMNLMLGLDEAASLLDPGSWP